MSGTVQKIKERLSITEVVGSYIDLEKSGASLKAKCPFHNEKTASFFLSPDRGTFYCFGCGAKGDIFSFVQDFERVDFLAALKMLAERAGVEIESAQGKEQDKDSRLFAAMEEATRLYQANLKEEKGALAYLQRRHLKIEMVRDWKIGFARNEWRSLKEQMQKGFSESELLDAGLIKESSKENSNGGSYDRFRGRIMFPIFDTAGRVIAFSGRTLLDKEGEPKYLNSPDTPLFDKSRTLYGYHVAKKFIREMKFAILVEGQMDMLLSQQAGFGNTVASSGTALTREHLTSLKRLTDTIVLAYDADNAGRNATFRAWKLALAAGFELRIAVLPDNLDPADAIGKDENIWKGSISKAINVIDYFLESIKSETDEKVGDLILKEKILPLIKAVESDIAKSRFIQKASFATGVAENALWDELAKVKEDNVVPEAPTHKSKKESSGAMRTAAFLLWLRELGNGYADEFETRLKEILPETDLASVVAPEDKDSLLFEMEMHYGNDTNLKNIGETLLRHQEEEILRSDYGKSMERLKKAEAMHDVSAVEQELALCQKISARLTQLGKT